MGEEPKCSLNIAEENLHVDFVQNGGQTQNDIDKESKSASEVNNPASLHTNNKSTRIRPATYATTTKTNQSVLIGKKSSTLKAVNKLSWIFVSRFLPQVTKDDIGVYLNDSGISQYECIELIPKYDTYKSFKIGFSTDLLDEVLNLDFWPEGILIKLFHNQRANKDNVRPGVFLGKPK